MPLLMGAVGAALFAYFLVALYSCYAAGLFSYHDLGLIDDFLSNTIRRGHIFKISETGVNHLSIHFTPSLFLFTPLYAWFESGFLLVFIGWVAFAVGIFFGMRIYRAITEQVPSGQATVTRPARPWQDCLFLLFITLNVYSLSVLTSAHFEVLYFAGAMALLSLLISNRNLPVLLPVALFTLGVRQDAGVFLFFQLLMTVLLTQGGTRKRAVILSVISLAYSILAIKFVMPLFGSTESLHIAKSWGEYGSTWTEVMGFALTHPIQMGLEVLKSGFVPLNLSFLMLPCLRPPLFLLANLPGALFYISSAADKKQLWYYNGAFLLPGMILATAVSLRGLLASRRFSRLAPTFVLVLLVAAVAHSIVMRSQNRSGVDFRIHLNSRVPEFAGYLSALNCAHASRVAADPVNTVFVPNRYERLLLDRMGDADLVVLGPGGGDEIDSAGFRLLHQVGNFQIFARMDLSCG